jgi:peptide deformylase
MEILKRTQFGNSILRQTAQKLSSREVASKKLQRLIKDMQQTLKAKKLGIGLAAPQVGESLALAIIDIQPTKLRSKVVPYKAVLINPEILETYGRRRSLWEGCISAGSSGKADLFAKVPRYNKVKVRYYDQKYKKHINVFEGLQAQVIQHEIDHLNGKLFVDRVKDTTTYATYSEYLKRIKEEKKKARVV